MAASPPLSASRSSVSPFRIAMPAPSPNHCGSVKSGPTNSAPSPSGVFRKPSSSATESASRRLDPAGDEVEIGFVLGGVGLDGDDVAVVVAQEVLVDGRPLHADGLALQAFVGNLDARAHHAHELGRRGVVLAGEVHLLLTLLGDRHRGDDGVVLLGQQAGDDAVPILHRPGAVELRRRAERVADVDVEALEVAVLVDPVEGWVGAFGA